MSIRQWQKTTKKDNMSCSKIKQRNIHLRLLITSGYVFIMEIALSALMCNCTTLTGSRWVRASPLSTNAQNFRGVKLIYELLNVQPALLRHYKYCMSKLVLRGRVHIKDIRSLSRPVVKEITYITIFWSKL